MVRTIVISSPQELRELVRDCSPDIKRLVQESHSPTLWEMWRFLVDRAKVEINAEVGSALGCPYCCYFLLMVAGGAGAASCAGR